jgi:hypothetical protein
MWMAKGKRPSECEMMSGHRPSNSAWSECGSSRSVWFGWRWFGLGHLEATNSCETVAKTAADSSVSPNEEQEENLAKGQKTVKTCNGRYAIR